MPMGPGKYDEMCTMVRETANADAAIVIIIKGNKGSGFSVQMRDLELLERMPLILESVAAEIRASSSNQD